MILLTMYFGLTWTTWATMLWDHNPKTEMGVSNAEIKTRIITDRLDDPYGFIMLDGPAGSLSDSFDSDFTVARRDEHITNIKRSLITTNKTLIDTVFEYSSKTIYVYCNHPNGSPKCEKIFYKGAEDTIIRLPNYVGEGPFARVVSMESAEESYILPSHHLVKRSTQKNEIRSTKWCLTIALTSSNGQTRSICELTTPICLNTGAT
jgi:hypothetical protein